jgi:4-amino-4-deoxy-L-arabinose transferase-like glycosyltransferase
MQNKLPLPTPILLLLAFVVIFISLDSLGHRKLANPDEGRYSEISREMAESGDFVTPRLNGLKYFEKPPMQYWATAISFNLFGETEFTARLYTALCGLGCIFLITLLGWRLYDAETGLIAGLVLLSAPYFGAMNEIITLDMGLTFWMTLAMTSFLLSQHADTDQHRRRWLWIAWAGMAGAVLSKGLIGIVFPTATIFLYGLVTRNLRLWAKLEWLRGLIIFFGLTAPWFVLVSLKNPEFPHFFFIHEHFERFLSDGHRRTEAWWFFLPIFFVGFLPWLFTLLPAMWQGWQANGQLARWQQGQDRAFQPLKFILIYTLFILLFFSKSSSKLPAYILPFFPVMALVVARFLQQADPRRLSWMVLPIVPLACYGVYAAWQAPARRARYDFSRQLYDEMSVWLMVAAAVIAFVVFVGFFCFRFQRKWSAILVISIGTMIGVELIERGYEKISPLQSSHATAEIIRPHLTATTRLYAVQTYDQSLPFYLGRTLTLVDYVDEFEMGQKREPEKFLASIDLLPAAWNKPGSAIALIPPNDVEKFRAMGLIFDVIHRDPRRAVILKKSTS